MVRRSLATICAAFSGGLWAITLTSPVSAQTTASAPAVNSPFLAETLANFTAWDADRDGALSLGEIEAAIANPRVTGKAAAAAVTLRRAVKSKTFKMPSPLTADSLARAVADAKSRPPAAPSLAPPSAAPPVAGASDIPVAPSAPSAATPRFAFDRLYNGSVTRIARANRNLFASGPPKLSALKQGKIGNCFCLAPLGALINRDASEVVRLFKVDADGVVTVTFGGGAKPVKVATVTDGEYALAASTGGDGVWANLYEKAVGQCRLEEKAGDTRTALGAVATGGSAGKIIELLTGNKIKRFTCAPFQKKGKAVSDIGHAEKLLGDLRGLLTNAMAQKRLVCGGTSKNVPVPGVTSNHAYAVIGYDAVRDEAVLWNPHGNTFKPKGSPGPQNGYATAGGTFRVPLPELVRFFGGFSFETEEKAELKSVTPPPPVTTKTP